MASFATPRRLAIKVQRLETRLQAMERTPPRRRGVLFDNTAALARMLRDRAEAAGLNISDEHYEELKKKRMTLKDEIYAVLKG